MKISLDNDGLPPLLKGVIQRIKERKFQTIILVLFILSLILLLIIRIDKPEGRKIIPNINTKIICNLKSSPIETLKIEEPKMPVVEYLPPPIIEPISEQRPDIAIETYVGEASHYTVASSSDRTACGETLIDEALTCALPPSIGKGRFGMRVRITNLSNGFSVVAKYNDSGPFCEGRIADLTTGTQQAIGMDGIAPVKIELLHTETSQVTTKSFAFGYCTDYVASKFPVIWSGDAKQWFYQAVTAGYKTGNNPSVGAILCTNESSWGHVAIVESYNMDGTIKVSEKNYQGWNQLSYRNVPSNIGTYIY